MKAMNLFLIAIICLAGLSCKKTKEGPVINETFVDIILVDAQNNNIIGHTETVDFQNLKIFYIINGNKELFMKENLDYSKGYVIIKNQDNQDVLRVFLNTEGEHPKTLIEYNNRVTDTVKSEFSKNGSFVICTKVWYNDVLEWEVNNDEFSSNRQFTVIKEF